MLYCLINIVRLNNYWSHYSIRSCPMCRQPVNFWFSATSHIDHNSQEKDDLIQQRMRQSNRVVCLFSGWNINVNQHGLKSLSKTLRIVLSTAKHHMEGQEQNYSLSDRDNIQDCIIKIKTYQTENRNYSSLIKMIDAKIWSLVNNPQKGNLVELVKNIGHEQRAVQKAMKITEKCCVVLHGEMKKLQNSTAAT